MDTTSRTGSSPSTPSPAATSAHRHSARCHWDVGQARWACPAPAGGGSRPAAGPAGEELPLVDVRDMHVVHTALLREFRLAPAAVARVPQGDRGHAARVDRHLGLLCDLLHHHHEGEDELLWPPLRERLPDAAQALLDAAEAQHAGLDAALDAVATARRRWVVGAATADGDALGDALRSLHSLLAEHLDDEERTLLPLAAAHLTQEEWTAVGEAGAASVPKGQLPLVFGMFAYEGDPEVLRSMLAAAPAVPRRVVPLVAPRVYARRALRVHGTRRP